MVSDKLVVVKHNDLIRAAQQLSVIESRIILSCIAQVNSKGVLSHLDKFSIHASELEEILGGAENMYANLKDAVDRLATRMIYLKSMSTRTSEMKSHWVHSVNYVKSEGRVDLYFAPFIIPFLSELSRDFTQYKLENVIKFQSSYGIGFYELLKSSMSSEVCLTLEFIQLHFQLGEAYCRVDNLQNRVIKPAIADINQHSDMTVSYEPVKQGRRVVSFKFMFVCIEEKKRIKSKFNQDRIDGILKTDLEKYAKPGESYSQAATRLKMEQMMLEKNGKEKTLDVKW